MLAFKCLGRMTGVQSALETEFKSAEYFQEIRIGNEHLFHRTFIRTKYIAFEEIDKAFLRLESGESGDFPTNTTYLVLITKEQVEIALHMERNDTAKKMLEYMKSKIQNVSYGFTK